jgi:hypothetical protein
LRERQVLRPRKVFLQIAVEQTELLEQGGVPALGKRLYRDAQDRVSEDRPIVSSARFSFSSGHLTAISHAKNGSIFRVDYPKYGSSAYEG